MPPNHAEGNVTTQHAPQKWAHLRKEKHRTLYLLEIVHHRGLDIHPQYELGIHLLLLELRRSDALPHLRPRPRQQHLAHPPITLAAPVPVRLLLQQLGYVIHAYGLVEVESLGVDEVHEDLCELSAGVIREFERDVEPSSQLVVTRQEEVHFGGEAGEYDQRRVPSRLVRVDAAHDLVHGIVPRVLRAGSLGRHAERVRLVHEEDAAPCLLQHLAGLGDRAALIGGDEVHPFDLEELGLSEYAELVVHLGEEAGHGRLSRAWVAEEYHVGGAGTSGLVGEGDAEHGGGEASYSVAVVGEEGFA
mmetsp:Transcript_31635/g.76581  ORF Transcript_31635/g.76581 Transcript_31635/m.76581 type:complete len:303 (+) Transcript_31635:69-977(+)